MTQTELLKAALKERGVTQRAVAVRNGQTVSISIPPRTATTFVSEDGNTISVAGADGSVTVTIKKGGKE